MSLCTARQQPQYHNEKKKESLNILAQVFFLIRSELFIVVVSKIFYVFREFDQILFDNFYQMEGVNFSSEFSSDFRG